MKMRATMAAVVAAAMMAMTVSLFAAERAAGTPTQPSEPIYGYRLMSDQERNDYRERMRNAPSTDARQAIRDEHRKLMEARARERGVTLPEPRGAGYGPRGEGRGPGYGPRAAGKGPGYGPGPRADCPGGQDCPGPGRGPGPRP
jgi:hypothetical protein